jgi:hypothetical protein
MSMKKFRSLKPELQALILSVDDICMRVGVTPILARNRNKPPLQIN